MQRSRAALNNAEAAYRRAQNLARQGIQAQELFDQGLAWCYGFHHNEALRCFAAAAAERDVAVVAADLGLLARGDREAVLVDAQVHRRLAPALADCL